MKTDIGFALFGAGLLLAAPTAFSEQLEIGAGSQAGEYTGTLVPAIDKKLRGHGYSAVAKISEGSQQNIEEVLAGTLKVSLSQWDVAALAMGEDTTGKLVLLGNMAPEALLCAGHKEGRVKSYADLTDAHDRPLTVSVGGERSGTARTFAYLSKIDERLGGLEYVYNPNIAEELRRLSSKNRDAVCFVMMPNPDNKLIGQVAEDESLRFFGIDNPQFAQVKINGKQIYDIVEVPVSPGVWGIGADTVTTLVTGVGLVINSELVDLGLSVILKSVMQDPELLPPGTTAGKAQALYDKYSVKAAELGTAALEKTKEYHSIAVEKTSEAMEKTDKYIEEVRKEH
jgi:TRAP-type uncharacterized transport system substrate-binding protein